MIGETMTDEKKVRFEGGAVVELMGHRRLAGKVSEETIAGAAMLRIDVYPTAADTPIATQFYSAAAIYCITPTTEALARAVALRGSRLAQEANAMTREEVLRMAYEGRIAWQQAADICQLAAHHRPEPVQRWEPPAPEAPTADRDGEILNDDDRPWGDK